MKKLITRRPGERISELRQAADMDQRDLGIAAGLYRGAIVAARAGEPIPKPDKDESLAAGELVASIEDGTRRASPLVLALLARALGVEALDLTQQVVDLTPEEEAARLAEEAAPREERPPRFEKVAAMVERDEGLAPETSTELARVLRLL